MEKLIHIWEYFLQSNAFNFVLLILIFVLIDKKVHFGNMIENVKNKIIETINKSKEEKNNAKKALEDAQKSIANLESEIKAKIDSATHNAENLAKKIIKETEDKVRQIESNIQKVIDAEEKTISSRLTNKAALQSIELAKNNIKTLLEKNPHLHEKYINESIESLDRINY